MKTFTDKNGRDWLIEIDFISIERVRDHEKFDLLSLLDPSGGKQLGADPLKHLRVLYALCRPQADAAGVTYEQFAQSQSWDSAIAAGEAMLEEIISFSPSRLRGTLQELRKKDQAFKTAALAKAAAAVQNLNVDELLGKILKDAATNSPASAESTPAASPTGS